MESERNAPAIALDLDGTIDEAPEFFRVLSACWPGKVFVITFRDDREKAERDVASFGIRCDEVIVVRTFEQKAVEIAKRGISVFVDDQDEILMHVPEGVAALKIRNGGNYDFESNQWLYSKTTGRQI
jgi:hypothetical protein